MVDGRLNFAHYTQGMAVQNAKDKFAMQLDMVAPHHEGVNGEGKPDNGIHPGHAPMLTHTHADGKSTGMTGTHSHQDEYQKVA